jgi:hypothetical protein
VTDEQPVFVDGTGKRRKLFQVAGVIAGVIIAGYAIALGVSLGTGAEVPLTTWVVPEKKTQTDGQKAKVRPKTAVPPAVPQQSFPAYAPPSATPSVTVTPTGTPTPTKTATARPTIVTKSPEPTEPTPTVTASPSPSATPTVTTQPPGEPDPSDPPVEQPPGQEKKTVEE